MQSVSVTVLSFKHCFNLLLFNNNNNNRNCAELCHLLQIAGMTTMKLVLRHRECDTDNLASMLLNAGYRLRSDDVTFTPLCRNRLHGIPETPHSPNDTGNFSASAVFSSHRQTVATLAHLCRLCLRRSVAESCRGRHFADSLHKLPLPSLLRDFVAFSGEFTVDLH